MSAGSKRKLTEAEYLAIERAAEFKSEFFNGEMFPMQGPSGPLGIIGATYKHNVVKANLSSAIGNQLKRVSCRTLSSDMRVKVSASGFYTYPDILVVCGEPVFADDNRDTLLNPTVVIEIVSPSTEKYDRGAKFRHYQKVASVKEYVLVAQDEPLCERFVRQPDESWLLTTSTGLTAELALGTPAVRVPLAEIYAGVTLPEHPPR